MLLTSGCTSTRQTLFWSKTLWMDSKLVPYKLSLYSPYSINLQKHSIIINYSKKCENPAFKFQANDVSKSFDSKEWVNLLHIPQRQHFVLMHLKNKNLLHFFHYPIQCDRLLIFLDVCLEGCFINEVVLHSLSLVALPGSSGVFGPRHSKKTGWGNRLMREVMVLYVLYVCMSWCRCFPPQKSIFWSVQ